MEPATFRTTATPQIDQQFMSHDFAGALAHGRLDHPHVPVQNWMGVSRSNHFPEGAR
jgi:hypothetical protein